MYLYQGACYSLSNEGDAEMPGQFHESFQVSKVRYS
jgi:hypothetical protein